MSHQPVAQLGGDAQPKARHTRRRPRTKGWTGERYSSTRFAAAGVPARLAPPLAYSGGSHAQPSPVMRPVLTTHLNAAPPCTAETDSLNSADPDAAWIACRHVR